MLDWFCKEESQAVEDLKLTGRKLCVADVPSLSEVPSIPGEAVEADLSVLKEFFTEEAWNLVLNLGWYRPIPSTMPVIRKDVIICCTTTAEVAMKNHLR